MTPFLAKAVVLRAVGRDSVSRTSLQRRGARLPWREMASFFSSDPRQGARARPARLLTSRASKQLVPQNGLSRCRLVFSILLNRAQAAPVASPVLSCA